MSSEELKANVEKALEEIRPFLQSDGGNISLLSIEDDKLSANFLSFRLAS